MKKIESASIVKNVINTVSNLKDARKNLREANMEYTSLSQVLKDITRKAIWNSGYAEAFALIHVSIETLTPAKFRSAINEAMLYTNEKTGKTVIGMWGTKVVKNKDGEVVKNADGTPKKEAVLRPVASWTPTKIWTVLAQSLQFERIG